MKILILDCNNLLYRTFWVAKTMSSEEEAPNLTVHLFMNAVFSYVNQFNPMKIYAVWDKKLLYPSENFRKQLLPAVYKANRDKSLTVDAHIHEEKLEELLKSIGIHNLFPYKLEADDVIGYLTKINHLYDNVIVTVDKDMLQLIDCNVSVYSPIKKELITQSNFAITNKGVEHKYFLTLKALTGDQSDNIDGLYKVGPKKGMKLAVEIVDNNNLNCLTDEQKVIFERNMRLMDLKRGFFEEDEYTHYDTQLFEYKDERNYTKFISLCEELSLNKILESKNKWYEKFFQSNKLNKLVEQLGLH